MYRGHWGYQQPGPDRIVFEEGIHTMGELTELSERSTALLPRLDELRRVADDLILMPRLELWDRLTWALGFCEHDLADLLAPDKLPEGELRDVLAVHHAELSALIGELREARKAFLVGEPNAKPALRRTLYGLHTVGSMGLRIQLGIVLPSLAGPA